MEPTMILVLFLSMGLALVGLMALNERRQRRGLQSLLKRVLSLPPSYHNSPETAHEKTQCTAAGDHAGGKQRL